MAYQLHRAKKAKAYLTQVRGSRCPSKSPRRNSLLDNVLQAVCGSWFKCWVWAYLHSEALRREIHEGLNVVEQWNGATDFVFFARRGELASNRHEDHEISMLALHLIQNCMVYVNTLMLQRVLAQPQWQGKLTPRDYAALTPLIWEHVNPYGRFDLDMNARLALL